MSEKNRGARPSLATFLHGNAGAAPTETETETDHGQPRPAPLPEPPAADADHTDTAHPGVDDAGQAQDRQDDAAAAADTLLDLAQDAAADAPADDDTLAASAPDFTRNARAIARAPRPVPRWQWALVAALGLLLALQIIVADRARLAADAGTRPLVSALCTVLRCSLPAWHEPAAYSMLSRDVRPLPDQPCVLQVQASFRNEARWAQAWPALRLSLSDADGRVIGRRTLQPADYLGAAADPQARLEPGQSAQVSFRLREPAAATVAFSFEFQ